MDTPFTSHITAEDYKSIYEPSEDTFLLLDAIEQEIPFLEKLAPTICLEIGSGSGVIITAISKRFKSSFCIASDINQHACKITKSTACHNESFVETINMDLASGFKPNLFDLIVFNPPYVPTTGEEEQSQCFENTEKLDNMSTSKNLFRTWAGGLNGRVVIDKILDELSNILSRNGVFYLLALKENNPEEIIQTLHRKGFKAIIFMERKIRGEHLYILKVIYS